MRRRLPAIRTAAIFFASFVVCVPFLVAGVFAFINAWAVYTEDPTLCWDWSSAPFVVECIPDTDVWVTYVVRGLLWFAVVAVAVWAVAVWSARPLRQVSAAVAAMGPQNLGQRIDPTGRHGETLAVIESVNAMMDRVANGYEAQRRFAANASHELRTPLAVQRTLVEVAMEDPQAAPHLDHLARQLLATNERNEHLIEGLVALADSDRGLIGSTPVRLDAVVEHAVETHAALAAARQVAVATEVHPIVVMGDPVLLERLVANLLQNAVLYNVPGGWVQVRVAAEPTLVVCNSGAEVPAEAIPRLFEPFRRLQAARTYSAGGAGLGLAIVASIVEAHRGTVTAEPQDGGGLRIAVSLPVIDAQGSG